MYTHNFEYCQTRVFLHIKFFLLNFVGLQRCLQSNRLRKKNNIVCCVSVCRFDFFQSFCESSEQVTNFVLLLIPIDFCVRWTFLCPFISIRSFAFNFYFYSFFVSFVFVRAYKGKQIFFYSTDFCLVVLHLYRVCCMLFELLCYCFLQLSSLIVYFSKPILLASFFTCVFVQCFALLNCAHAHRLTVFFSMLFYILMLRYDFLYIRNTYV